MKVTKTITKRVKRKVTGFVVNLGVAGDLFLLSIDCSEISDVCDFLSFSVS